MRSRSDLISAASIQYIKLWDAQSLLGKGTAFSHFERHVLSLVYDRRPGLFYFRSIPEGIVSGC